MVGEGGAGLQEAHPCTCRLARSVGKVRILVGQLGCVMELGAIREGGDPKTGKPGLQEAEGQTPLTCSQRIQMDNTT